MRLVHPPLVTQALMDSLPQQPRPLPEPSFVWGEGGTRMSMEEVARQREIAADAMAAGADYSPVGHWTQGAARLANAVGGRLRDERAQEAAEANAAESASVMQALMNPVAENGSAGGGSGGPSVAALLAAQNNPYLSDSARDGLESLLESHLHASRPFTIGRNRLQFDPATGQTTTLYDGQEDFEIYAERHGLVPGTEAYERAIEDYILRSSGPSAHDRDLELDDHRTENDRELEGYRQENRLGLEGVRQDNRLQLRRTPPARAPSSRSGGSRHSRVRVRQGERTATGANGETLVVRDGEWVVAE